ncbi:DUF6377 domain-containing protein [Pedobacter jamesrossensis]|uniref:DUF6377 domain-containing protein n=1 Tax=Pedobacter jamesrossensis TaxID=1908238 RepID=A0ABV8NPJ3_9SPHI
MVSKLQKNINREFYGTRIGFTIFFIIAIGFVSRVFANDNIDSLKRELSDAIANKVIFDSEKQNTILKLKKKFSFSQSDYDSRYQACVELFKAYKSFIHDSAFVYAKKANQYANLIGDDNKINQSRVNLGFVLISSGMFKEGLDTLTTVKSEKLTSEEKFRYYFLMARSNFDLSDYNKIDDYSKLYTREGLKYCDTIINNYSPNSYQYLSGMGLKLLRSKNYKAALVPYEKLIKLKTSYQDSAINFSCLSYLYFSVNQPDKGLAYLIKSSILDNVHSIKESLALVNLSKYLYSQGETRAAFAYIHSAIEDNDFYGAKQRKVEISNILPIIERDKINGIEKQKRSLIIYASIITLLTLLTIYFGTKTFKQLKKIRIADQLIINQNHDLNEVNNKLLRTNKSLDSANHSLISTVRKLDEANLIKEEYIGHFFNVSADYIEKLDRLKRSLEKVVHLKRFEELNTILQRLNTSQERESFFASFDEVFLNLFPDFISEFNSLFDEEHKTQLSTGQLLNNELRIFALIRLGIDENEMIAKILNYSVNTIYTYKTKVKNRSIVPNEEFAERILSIRTVKNDMVLETS